MFLGGLVGCVRSREGGGGKRWKILLGYSLEIVF